MKRISVICIIATFMLALIVACVKDLEKEGIYTETEIIGTVVEKSTNTPLGDIKVSITDGDHIHASAITNSDGTFQMKVNFSEVNEDYYLLLDGSPDLPSKQEEMRGMGSKYYDYKMLVLYDKTDTNLLPKVTTGEASNISGHTATVRGTVSFSGGKPLTGRGICYATHQSPTIEDSCSIAIAEVGVFNCNLINLQTNTTYYYRAYATNGIGISYGEQKTFTTTNGLPEVTATISSFTGSNASLRGNVTNDNGSAVTERGFCWSTSQNPTVNGNHITSGEGTGVFNGLITDLTINTTYYVKAYATNSNGTNYSSQLSFQTTSGLPTVTTITPTYDGEIVTIGGNVTSDGGFAVTARGICYGSSPNPDLSGSYTHTENGSGTGCFQASFDLPNGSGIKYVRAYATNANGTSYGEQMTVMNPYEALPTFTYNGHTYKVAPDPFAWEEYYSWIVSNAYCEELTAYGYSDWRLPTKEELTIMWQYRDLIGGFIEYYGVNHDWGTEYRYGAYFSSTLNPETSYHYVLRTDYAETAVFHPGNYDTETGHILLSNLYSHTRLHVHVRPIRIDE